MNNPDNFLNFQLISSYDQFLKKMTEPEKLFLGRPKIGAEENACMWFRGQADFKWNLIPSLYRHESFDSDWTTNNWRDVKKQEENRINLFKVRNYHHFPNGKPENKYLWFCVMQHFQVHTRLLDWTESAEVAFFFALYFYFQQQQIGDTRVTDKYLKPGHKDTLPCVWILNPKVMLKQNSSNKFIPDIYTARNQHFDDSPPMPVLAPYNNERIKSQSGTFTIFPINHPRPFRSIRYSSFIKKPCLENLPNANRFLCQLIITHPEECYAAIKQIGSKISMYYPEMPYIDDDIEKDIYNVYMIH
jgi:hypothetical protein